MDEIRIPQSYEVNSDELRVRELFDKAVAIGKTINSFPDHNVTDETYYLFLKESLYSIATELGFDISNPDSLRNFHIMIWDYWHEGEFNYPISNPTEDYSRSDQEAISAEKTSVLLNNILQLIDALDYEDKTQSKRLIEDLEFIAVILGFDISSKESMLEFTKLLNEMPNNADESTTMQRSDFDLAA